METDTTTRFVLHHYLCYLICISTFRLRQMHRTIPSAQWSLSQVTQSCFIPRLSATLLEGTWHMKNNYMPLCKLLSNGDTTLLARKHSFLLAISLYSLPHPSRNYRQLDNWSGLITCNNFSWRLSIRKKKPMPQPIISADQPLLYCLQWWACRVMTPLLGHNCIQ